MNIDVPFLYNQVRPYAIAAERRNDLLEQNPNMSVDALTGRIFAGTVVEVASRLGIVLEENDRGEFKASVMVVARYLEENVMDGINLLVRESSATRN